MSRDKKEPTTLRRKGRDFHGSPWWQECKHGGPPVTTQCNELIKRHSLRDQEKKVKVRAPLVKGSDATGLSADCSRLLQCLQMIVCPSRDRGVIDLKSYHGMTRSGESEGCLWLTGSLLNEVLYHPIKSWCKLEISEHYLVIIVLLKPNSKLWVRAFKNRLKSFKKSIRLSTNKISS